MNKKILLIEDDVPLREAIYKKLLQEGYDVDLAKDGIEGLEKIRMGHPDLILLDIILPRMNGFEILDALAAEGSVKAQPVIIISNSGQPVEIEKALQMGVKDYLVKADFGPDEVIEKVKKQIGGGTGLGEEVSLDEAPREKKELAMPEKQKSQKGAGKKILIVEDDKFLRDLVVFKLEQEGFGVIEVATADEALEKVKQEKPDLILLDIILPGKDGFIFLQEMKQDASIASIPVIALSNLGQDSEIKKGLELGAKDYLVKASLTPSEIIEKIMMVLG